MLDICILELIKNENGFFTASQTVATACLRSYLKCAGISSMIYTDDTLPSLNDLAEDILSVADDAIVLIVNNENAILVNALVVRIASLEDIPLYLVGMDKKLRCADLDNVTVISNTRPEEQLTELLGGEQPGVVLMECSPYEKQILLPQDAEKFGIWFGRDMENGEKEYRSTEAVQRDAEIIHKAFEGLSLETKKLIPCDGIWIDDLGRLQEIVSCFPDEQTPLQFICPVHGNLVDEIPDNDNVIWKVLIPSDWDIGMYMDKLLELVSRQKVACVRIETEVLEKNPVLWEKLSEYVRNRRLEVEPVDKLPEELLSGLDVLMGAAASRYVPFSRGFMKSRTGVYAGVALDGYVKHVEVMSPQLDDDTLSCLNELASVNSSVYMKDAAERQETAPCVEFDDNGVAVVKSDDYDLYCAQHLRANAIESNFIRIQDSRLRVNNLAYVSPQRITELPYREAAARMPEMENNFATPEAYFYVFTMDCAEDFQCFLKDAETFKKSHTLKGLPLAYGYLKNYCRFLNSNSCSVDKMPRIQLTGDGNVYVCSNFTQPIGKCGQAIFELTQNCYVKKENLIKERDCAHCGARSWCAKCTQLPPFMAEEYCDIVKKRSYVIDYIISSVVYIDMVSSVPSLKKIRPQNVRVTSEYMFNLTDGEDHGKELPYFPKFSYLFICEPDTYVLWLAASGKYFHVSPQFAQFAEMLFKRMPVIQIMDNMRTVFSVSQEESRKMYETIVKTLNQSGALYRTIKD